MKKANLLIQCGKRSLLLAIVFAAVMAILTLPMMSTAPTELMKSMIVAILAGAIGGGIMGIVWVGRQVSKPFPFGPALALGGFVAMFLIPYWLPFY